MIALAEFLTMGGYAAYVWAAFGLTLVVMVALFWQSWHMARKRTAELAAWRERRATQSPRPQRRLVAEPPRPTSDIPTTSAG